MIEPRDVADDCNSVIIDILKNRLPRVVELLEFPKDTDGFQYFIKAIELDEETGFVKVVFCPDFNYRDYIWYFRGGFNEQ